MTYKPQQDMINTIPAGTIHLFAMTSIPEGWLKCNGDTISREIYSNLFNAIGTSYGPGDGETTFKLPDLRGEFIRGWDDGRSLDSGRVFGSVQAHSTYLPSHKHDSGTYRIWDAAAGPYGVAASTTVSNPLGRYVGSAGVRRDYTGNASTSTEVRPRNIAMLYCIKT